jgi:alkylation response protein AidB-like acyl-CoA dehydrogenase
MSLKFSPCVGSPAQKERYFAEVVNQGAIFAAIGSEPNASPNSRAFVETWNAMAMRATASHSMTLRDGLVRAEDIVGPPGVVFTSGLGSEYAVGYAAIYCSIAEVAYEFARDYARTRVIKPDTQHISGLSS